MTGVILCLLAAQGDAGKVVVAKHEIGKNVSPWVIWQYNLVFFVANLPLIYPKID